MASETVANILKNGPRVRCFAIASDDLAQVHSEKAARHLPRPKRRPAARNAYNKWKRSVDSIVADARSQDYDALIERLTSLPLDAVRLAFDADAADAAIDNVVATIQERPGMAIGIAEQFVTDELVFVWLWNDR